MAEQATQKTPRAPTVFSTSIGSAADLNFSSPVGRTGSQYDELIKAVKALTNGQILTITPESGTPPKALRNRVTAPLRKKAEPFLKDKGLRLRIRINTAGVVCVQCVEAKAPKEEGDEGAAE